MIGLPAVFLHENGIGGGVIQVNESVIRNTVSSLSSPSSLSLFCDSFTMIDSGKMAQLYKLECHSLPKGPLKMLYPMLIICNSSSKMYGPAY